MRMEVIRDLMRAGRNVELADARLELARAVYARAYAAASLEERAFVAEEEAREARSIAASESQARAGAGERVECAECGHLHFNPATKTYGPCPVCDCEGQ